MPEVLIISTMSLYEGTQTRVTVDSELLEKFAVKEGMHQGPVLPPFILVVAVDVVTEFLK